MSTSIELLAGEFLPLLGAIGVGAICAVGGMFAAKRTVVGAIGEAVPRIAVRLLAVGLLGFGLASLTGLAPIGTQPLVIMTSLFAGFLTLAVADLSRRSNSAVLGGSANATIAGSIVQRTDQRNAA